MTLRHTIIQTPGLYTVTISPDKEAPGEGIPPPVRQKLAEYGSFELSLGGLIDPEVGASATLPARDVRIPAAFPLVQQFSTDEFANAKDLAIAWETKVLTDLGAALVAFMAQQAFSSTNVTTLPLS